MSLSSLKKLKQREKKRVGRGVGSGKGSHTSDRGQKGQTSRSGNQIREGFEGGQNPLFKRLPRLKGVRIADKADSRFASPRKRTKVQVSLGSLNSFNDGDKITEEVIRTMKNVKGLCYVKIIDSGEITKKLTIEGVKVTKGAKSKIEKAGGNII